MEAPIKIKLFATLSRKYTIPDNINLSDPRMVGEILIDLCIPPEEAAIIFIDGKHAELTDTVYPGQTLSLFPAIGGG